jgi:hypothetical protein
MIHPDSVENIMKEAADWATPFDTLRYESIPFNPFHPVHP